jgi:aryl-alcohol dehydrogenase-like predicted oxidoreductase
VDVRTDIALLELFLALRFLRPGVALAWLLARPSVTAPIASATSLEQFSDLVETTRLDLDTAALEQLNRASA